MTEKHVIAMIARTLPVHIVSERPAEIREAASLGGLEKITSPWRISYMTPEALHLDRRASLQEVCHELGHCIDWCNERKPAGKDWGFGTMTHFGDSYAVSEREINACAVGVYLELEIGKLTFKRAVHRMMYDYNFDEYAKDCNMTHEAWTRLVLRDGRAALCAYLRATGGGGASS